MTSVRGWTRVAENPPVMVREYAFGVGRSNAMAVGLPNGKLMIVSPPINVPEAELRELGAIGECVALVANNGFHHLGLGPSRAAFPKAVTYAAPRAAERIRAKGKDVGQLEPIEALQPLPGDKVGVTVVDGEKKGDVIVRVKTEKGTLLYASDFIANIQKLPSNVLFKTVFRLIGSGRGLKAFKLFFLLFSKRGAARDFLIREIEAAAPTTLVPAHGEIVTRSDLAPTLVSILRAAPSPLRPRMSQLHHAPAGLAPALKLPAQPRTDLVHRTQPALAVLPQRDAMARFHAQKAAPLDPVRQLRRALAEALEVFVEQQHVALVREEAAVAAVGTRR